MKKAGLIRVIKFNRISFRKLRLPLAVLVVLFLASTLLLLCRRKSYEGEDVLKKVFSVNFPSDCEADDTLAGAEKTEPTNIEIVSPPKDADDDFPIEPPQQGTIIPCQECTVLYPTKYKDNPQSCLFCSGRKEHFQPARMMNDDLATKEAHELELKIEDFYQKKCLGSRDKPVSLEILKELRELYIEKLIFHLIYDKFELEPIKLKILELDNQIREFK